MVEDFWLLTLRVAQHTVAVAQVALEFHKTDGDQAVKPGVSQRLDHGAEALLLNTLSQHRALLGNARWERLASNQQYIPCLFDTDRQCWIKTQAAGTQGNGLDKVETGLGGVFFQGGAVHSEFLTGRSLVVLAGYSAQCRGTPLHDEPSIK